MGSCSLAELELDPVAAGAPALCREPASPLDKEGRHLLLALESQLANEVLGNAKLAHDGQQLNTNEVHSMLRQYPQAEMVFVFPVPIEVRASPFHTRLSATPVSYSRVGPPAFQLEIADIVMMRLRSQDRASIRFQLRRGGPSPERRGLDVGHRRALLRHTAGAWEMEHPSALGRRCQLACPGAMTPNLVFSSAAAA